MGRLTVAKIRRLRTPGRYGDGGTLFLVVSAGGSKSFVQRLTIDGERHDIGLGGWPLTSLAEARERAFDNRRIARKGGDPRIVRPDTPDVSRGRGATACRAQADLAQSQARRFLAPDP